MERAVRVAVFEGLVDGRVLGAGGGRVGADREVGEVNDGVVAARAELAFPQLLERSVNVGLVWHHVIIRMSAHACPPPFVEIPSSKRREPAARRHPAWPARIQITRGA